VECFASDTVILSTCCVNGCQVYDPDMKCSFVAVVTVYTLRSSACG
jgi:hypothetical protein